MFMQGLPEWPATMDGWGSKLLEAVTAVSKMAALGFGLPADAFSSLMAGGPHLLAPTGSDLVKHGAVGTVLAGFHYDLNFITVSVSRGVHKPWEEGGVTG
jgi:isopenicillin N synthase-like dioxygenase